MGLLDLKLSNISEQEDKKLEPDTSVKSINTPQSSGFNISSPKTKKSKDTEGPQGLFKVLDLLSRPNYAIAGAAKELAEIRGGDKEGSVGSVFKEAKKGFFGEERDTFSDVLGAVGWAPETKAGRIAKGVSGFALDVLLDPTTYIGIGGLTKTGRMLNKTGQLATTSTKQAQQGQRALVTFMGKDVVKGEKVFQKVGGVLDHFRQYGVVNKLGKSFVPGFRPDGVTPEVWQQLGKLKTAANNTQIFRDNKALEKAQEMYILMNDVAKNITDEDTLKLLTSIEKPKLIKNLPENLQNVSRIAREYLDELGSIRKSLGKKVIDSDDFKYLPHVHKQDLIDDIANIFSNSRVYSGDSPADIARQVFKFTDEAGEELIGRADDFGLNKVKGGNYVDNLGNKFTKALPTVEEKAKVYKNLETNLPTLLATSGRRSAKQESATQLFNSLSELSVNKGGIDTATSLKDARHLPKSVLKDAPQLKGHLFNKQVVEEVTRVHKGFTNMEEVKSFVKVYDRIQNMWKASATFVNPSFHSRNAVSNVYLNSLAGVKNPKSYLKASIIQARLSGAPISKGLKKSASKLLGVKSTDDITKYADNLVSQYWDQYQKNGLSRSFFGAEINQSLKRSIEPNFLQKAVDVGGKTGDLVETNARLAHFIDKIGKGFQPDQAAMSVKKFLFDYQDLTDFERNVMKRVFPFYTWVRKNLPLQVEQLARKPGYAVGLLKGKTNVEKALGTENVDKKLIPRWLKEASPVYLQDKDGKVKVFKLEGYIPLADIGRAEPKQFLRQFVGMSSPLIKVMPELLSNYNSFFNDKIERFKGEKGDFLRLNENEMSAVVANPYVEHVLRQIRPLTELDKIIGQPKDGVTNLSKTMNFLFGGKIYHIDKKKQRSINQFLKSKRLGTLKAAAKKARRVGNFVESKRLLKLARDVRTGVKE